MKGTLRQLLWPLLVVLLGVCLFRVVDAARYKHGSSAVSHNAGYGRGPSVVLRTGTTPWPSTNGALFLDTDASENGTVVCYANGAWRIVMELP